AGYNLNSDMLIMGFRHRAVIQWIEGNLIILDSNIPVHHKLCLHLQYGIASYAQMRIAPLAKMLIQAQIFIANIKAANIADMSIDPNELAMIAKVDFNVKEWNSRREKRGFLTSRLMESFKKLAR